MAIILAGDTHGLIDLKKVTDYFETYPDYTKSDYLIILGDGGILWDEAQDNEVQEILDNLPVTTLWIDGNHENFDMLYSYPEGEWKGGKVHFITESIIHLCRGQIFEIDGKSFFVFGGGNSIDKIYRTWGISWWTEEMPSNEEYEEGLHNLEKAGWKVDYILSHSCPMYIAGQLATYLMPGEEPLQKYFDEIAEKVDFEAWYFGHWHMDETIDNFQCLYNEMVEL